MTIKSSITVTDARDIMGVEYARDRLNATLAEGETPLTSDAYIQFVMKGAIADWANQAEYAAKLAAARL